MSEHPLGWVAQQDQVDAGLAQLAHTVAGYYHRLRQAGAPPDLARELTAQYQDFVMHLSAHGAE